MAVPISSEIAAIVGRGAGKTAQPGLCRNCAAYLALCAVQRALSLLEIRSTAHVTGDGLRWPF
jgi:hypothetical protein